MKILISNDDGVAAPGIIALNQALSEFADTTVVAPDRNRSGASSSLTLEDPIRIKKVAEGIHAISGTPADCVLMSRQLFFADAPPDLVVCGINMGANLGDDVIYSGTVAGAIEGCFMGVPAIAFSLVDARKEYIQGAARIAAEIVKKGIVNQIGHNQILNVNIPDRPYDEIQGFRVTNQGHRHRDNAVLTDTDPRGRPIYWIGPVPPGNALMVGSDFEAIEAGFVSITPLSVDLTSHRQREQLEASIGALQL
jgi:5'-nucleotidase